MAKILNLDSINARVTREFVLNSVTYAVKEMSVEDFIETTQTAERLVAETSYAVQMQETIKLIMRAVPAIDEATLRNLSLEKLQAVTAFVRGEEADKIMAKMNEQIAEEDGTAPAATDAAPTDAAGEGEPGNDQAPAQ